MGSVPGGLSLRKKINVINPKASLEIDIRTIQYNAELLIIKRIVQHYYKTHNEIEQNIKELDEIISKLTLEDRGLIRCKIFVLSENPIYELKEKRISKSQRDFTNQLDQVKQGLAQTNITTPPVQPLFTQPNQQNNQSINNINGLPRREQRPVRRARKRTRLDQ